MEFAVQTIVSILTIVMGSAGLWSFLAARRERKAAQNSNDTVRTEAMIQMMMGLGYDQIVTRGLGYISRGWISKDEFEDFDKLFYIPYKILGGNGLAEKIRNQVEQLPFTNPQLYFELRPNNRQEYNSDGWNSPASGFSRTSIEQPRL